MKIFRTFSTRLTTWTKIRAVPRLKLSTPSFLQVAGVALFDIGCFHLATWLGFMFAGALVALIGWGADK